MIIWAMMHTRIRDNTDTTLRDRCARSAEEAKRLAYEKYPDAHRNLDQHYAPFGFTLERVP